MKCSVQTCHKEAKREVSYMVRGMNMRGTVCDECYKHLETLFFKGVDFDLQKGVL